MYHHRVGIRNSINYQRDSLVDEYEHACIFDAKQWKVRILKLGHCLTKPC